MRQVMLFATLQNSDLSAVHANTVIPIRHGDPTFRPDLDKERIQTDILNENQRVANHMNTWRQNDILPWAFKIHDAALIDPNNFQVTNGAFDDIVAVIAGKTVHALQGAVTIQAVVARAINLGMSTDFRTVLHQGKMVAWHLEDRSKPEEWHAALEQMDHGGSIPRNHLHFLGEYLEVWGVQGDQVLVAESLFKVGVGSGEVLFISVSALVVEFILDLLVDDSLATDFFVDLGLVHRWFK